MADDKKKTGSPDSKRINVKEQYELKDWSKSLGVTPAKLKALVKEHGTSSAAIKKAIVAPAKKGR